MENQETDTKAEFSGDSEGDVRSISRTGFDDGRAAAPEAAKKFYGKVSQMVGKAAYGLSYYTGFGAGFAAALAREVIPGRIREGFSVGSNDGGDAAQKSVERMREETQGNGGLDNQPLPESA